MLFRDSRPMFPLDRPGFESTTPATDLKRKPLQLAQTALAA